MNNENNIREGWICPKCKKIKSPDVKSCDCNKNEQKDVDKDTRQLLNE